MLTWRKTPFKSSSYRVLYLKRKPLAGLRICYTSASKFIPAFQQKQLLSIRRYRELRAGTSPEDMPVRIPIIGQIRYFKTRPDVYKCFIVLNMHRVKKLGGSSIESLEQFFGFTDTRLSHRLPRKHAEDISSRKRGRRVSRRPCADGERYGSWYRISPRSNNNIWFPFSRRREKSYPWDSVLESRRRGFQPCSGAFSWSIFL